MAGVEYQGEVTQSMIKAKYKIDSRRFRSKSRALINELVPYAEVTAEQIAKQGVDIVSELTPRSAKGTQHMADMWEYTKSRKARVLEFVIENMYPNQDIVLYMEEGTKAHNIPVGGKGFLAWEGPGGKYIYTRRAVKHPGTRPYFMLKTTEQQMDALTDKYVTVVLARASSIDKRGR